jgi:hypothetical protein
MPTPATSPESQPDAQLPDSAPGHPDLLEQAAAAIATPFTLARQLLPDSPVPVALGAGALVLAGAIEWPVAAAIGLGYVALRRWHFGGADGGTHPAP